MAGCSPDVLYFVDKGTVPQYGSLRKIKKMPVKSSGPSSAEVDKHFNPGPFHVSVLEPLANVSRRDSGPLSVGT